MKFPIILRQQADVSAWEGTVPTLGEIINSPRQFFMGSENMDMELPEFLLHRERELQQHTIEKINEYLAIIKIIGVLVGANPGPPTREELMEAIGKISEEIGGYFENLIRENPKDHWTDYVDPVNVASTLTGTVYQIAGNVTTGAGGLVSFLGDGVDEAGQAISNAGEGTILSGVADFVGGGVSGVGDAAEFVGDGAQDLGYSWYSSGSTMATTDVSGALFQAAGDLKDVILNALAQWWDNFWEEVEKQGFLIAIAKLQIDAEFFAMEIAIEVALASVTAGWGAAAIRAIRFTVQRVGRTVSRVTMAAKVGDGPSARLVTAAVVDVPDETLELDHLIRAMDEDLLSAEDGFEVFARREAAEGATGATTQIVGRRGANRVAIEVAENGRPTRAQAVLREDFGSSTRGDNATTIGQTGRHGDQGGHLVAHRFLGDTSDSGIVPQAGNLNQGAWKTMENEWADWINNYTPSNKDAKVEIRVTIDIDPPGSVRPDKFEVEYEVVEILDGEIIHTVHEGGKIFNNSPGEKFERIYFRDN